MSWIRAGLALLTTLLFAQISAWQWNHTVTVQGDAASIYQQIPLHWSAYELLEPDASEIADSEGDQGPQVIEDVDGEIISPSPDSPPGPSEAGVPIAQLRELSAQEGLVILHFPAEAPRTMRLIDAQDLLARELRADGKEIWPDGSSWCISDQVEDDPGAESVESSFLGECRLPNLRMDKDPLVMDLPQEGLLGPGRLILGTSTAVPPESWKEQATRTEMRLLADPVRGAQDLVGQSPAPLTAGIVIAQALVPALALLLTLTVLARSQRERIWAHGLLGAGGLRTIWAMLAPSALPVLLGVSAGWVLCWWFVARRWHLSLLEQVDLPMSLLLSTLLVLLFIAILALVINSIMMKVVGHGHSSAPIPR